MSLPIPTNPLRDIVPAKYRKVTYALIGLLSIGWGVYQASDGDWRSLVGGLVVALTQLTAASNVPPDKPGDEPVVPSPDTNESE